MKDQIEFHYEHSDDPFIVNPNDIRRVSKWGDNAMIQMNWKNGDGGYEEIEVSESYETVKRKLLDHKYPHANDIAPDYVEKPKGNSTQWWPYD